MAKMICQIYLMNKKINYEETLLNLGYKLQDRGPYWQTNALYRHGDNKTALQIYKDTGVWKDYVNNTAYMPFEKLVQATIGSTDSELVSSSISHLDSYNIPSLKKDLPIMEKTYDPSCLNRLLPHYEFYSKKGIQENLLKEFQCGLCTEGKMYQRIVFPVFNLNNKIHGFSGRDMLDLPDRPKWKHIGVKTKWVYPHHLSEEYILKEKSVILVESIGDVLSLYSKGYKNCLCLFGLNISPSLINYLVKLNPEKIILSLNNDSNKEYNSGLISSIKCFYKLISFFDYDKIIICQPERNDFGDMDLKDYSKWRSKLFGFIESFDYNHIINKGNDLLRDKNSPTSLVSKILKFKKVFNNE